MHWHTTHSQSHWDQVTNPWARCPLNSAPLWMSVLPSLTISADGRRGAGISLGPACCPQALHPVSDCSAEASLQSAALKSQPVLIQIVPVLQSCCCCCALCRPSEGSTEPADLRPSPPLSLCLNAARLPDRSPSGCHRKAGMEDGGHLCSQRGAQRGWIYVSGL